MPSYSGYSKSGKTSPARLKKYKWKGRLSSGQQISGNTLALSELHVHQQLQRESIRVLKLKTGTASVFERIKHKVRTRDVNLFTRQLATMLNAGIPLLQALQLIANNQEKAEMKSLLYLMIGKIEAGTPLSLAASSVSPLFQGLYSDLIAAGEQSGKLPQLLDRLATYREKDEVTKAQVVKALIYPLTVFIVAVGVSYLMLTTVVPEFEAMFKSLNAELPLFTRQVLKLSDWLRSSTPILLFALIGGGIIFRWIYLNSPALQLRLSSTSLNLPLFGTLISKSVIARFCRTMATGFSAGVPIIDCLKTGAKTAGNKHYQQLIIKLSEETASGVPVHIAMQNSKQFPEMVSQLVMIGEESGTLELMLNKIAVIYESEITDTVESLGKLIEPFIIIFLGLMVGGLVVSMYLPIFNLMSVLG